MRCSSTRAATRRTSSAIVPPYDGQATVEKVAINAVMAGCAARSCRSCSPPSRPPADEAFALHGLVATTHPAGPVVIVCGPYPTGRA